MKEKPKQNKAERLRLLAYYFNRRDDQRVERSRAKRERIEEFSRSACTI